MSRKFFWVIVVLSIFIHLESSSQYQVVSVVGDSIQINVGSDGGVETGFTGKVFYYYKNMKTGIKDQINIASFRVESVEKNSCRARVFDKKQNVENGFWISFDQVLKEKKTEVQSVDALISKQDSSKPVPTRKLAEPSPSIQSADKIPLGKPTVWYIDMGWKMLDEKNPSLAREYFKIALRRDPENVGAKKGMDEANTALIQKESYYSIQVGVYADFANAKKESEKFSKLGYQTEILSTILRNQKLFRVRVVKFTSLEEAEKTKIKLDKQEKQNFDIVNPNGTFAELAQNRLEVDKQKRIEPESKSFTPVIQLRSSYQTLSADEVKSMLSRKGFYDKYLHPSKTFNNLFEKKTINGDEVVVDHATRLMWQQGGSSGYMTLEAAKRWVEDLNQQGYAGYSDWRLPTLEEGASLIESSKRNGDLYIDPVFSGTQSYIWTGNLSSSSSAWEVSFSNGNVNSINLNHNFTFYVRAVRSGQ